MRTNNLNIRISPQQRELVRCAAHIIGKSNTEFVLNAVIAAAETTLLDQRLFVVNGQAWQDVLDQVNSTTENPPLKTLLSSPSPWN